jgi:hypothetical protein
MLKTTIQLLGILIFLSCKTAFAQRNYSTITGKITEASSFSPVPYATVQLKNGSLGTACNGAGEFILKIPPEGVNDSLLISSVGFKTQIIPISSDHLDIKLKPAPILLNSITIKTVDALDIMKRMVASIPDNYDTSAARLTAFYREFMKLSADTISYNESVLDIYKAPAYKPNHPDQIKLLKGRKMKFDQHGDPLFYNWMTNITNTAYSSLMEDIQRFPEAPKSVINPDNFRDYSYTYEGTLEEGNMNLLIIAFAPRQGNRRALVQGRLYLDESSLAIVKAEWTTTPAGVSYVNKHGKGGLGYKLSTISVKATFDFTKISLVINYKQYQGKWYLNGIQRHWNMVVNSPRRNMTDVPWDGKFTMQVTDLHTRDIQPFVDSTLNRTGSVNGVIGHHYDTAFWEHHNFQLPEADTSIHISNRQNGFTRADTLRGMLSSLRTCYDVSYYDLSVKVDPEKKYLKGSNIIRFKVVEPFTGMQVDLYSNMKINQVRFHQRPLKYTREYDAVFITLPEQLKPGTEEALEIDFEGSPQLARPDLPMWGGILWDHTSYNETWVQMVCQGSGASLWWPNKDHQSDEPDSMRLRVTVPEKFTEISNGRLISKTPVGDSQTLYEWKISYPVNNYNVSFCFGDYAQFTDTLQQENGYALPLAYAVLSPHLAHARKLFQQVKPMLRIYEKYFGPYPFPRDGFRLIESPYPMEHQSGVCIGKVLSDSSLEMLPTVVWHEVAHEWWGNAVTSKDIADMWIHEGFATYAESLMIEELFGKESAAEYLSNQRSGISGKEPVTGVYDVNHIHYDIGDMYSKGSLLLHTLRNSIHNDSTWFGLLKSIQEHFRYQTVTAAQLIDFMCAAIGRNYKPVFDQYLNHTGIPTFVYALKQKGTDVELQYKWKDVIPTFNMPVWVNVSEHDTIMITPGPTVQTLLLKNRQARDFKLEETAYLVNVKRE